MSRAGQVRLLDGFGDRSFPPEAWNGLLARGESDVVFLTWEWQKAWWDSFGRGQLLLVLAERDGRPAALAPLFADGGMLFLVGSGGSDYLDLIGDFGDERLLEAALAAACERVRGFVGVRLYHLPGASRTAERVAAAAARLGLQAFDEGSLPAPALALGPGGAAAVAAAGKASLVRHDRALRRDGPVEVTHLRDGRAILPHLEPFFEQHVARWEGTGHPSLFTDPGQRAFYRRLCELAAGAGWLRFTRVDWRAAPAAFHFGSSHRGRYLWYKPSFAVELARRSPGEVLLRQLLLAAREEEAEIFDFGLGDEPFKARFADRVEHVRTCGLYPVRRSGET